MKLTEHFRREEFTRSQIAARIGVSNEPSPEAWRALEALAVNVLEPARAALGPIIVTSGYRAPALNARIPGSSKNSQHTLGQAADIELIEGSNRSLFRWIFLTAPFDQLIWEYGNERAPAWVHVSYVESGRRSVLRATRDRVQRRFVAHYRPMTAQELAGIAQEVEK